MRKGFLCALVVLSACATSNAQTPATASCDSCARISWENPCAERCSTVWLKADFLQWWTKDGPLPSPALTSGTPASNGIVGDPGTRLLYATGSLDYDFLMGGRLTAGAWIDSCRKWGVEASGFFLETGTTNFSVASDEQGSPLIAFPIIDGQTGLPSSQLVANFNQFAGAASISSRSRFWGFDLHMVYAAHQSCNSRLELIGGYRQLGLSESLLAQSQSTLLEQGVAGFLGDILLPGETLSIYDQIRTNNHFYGGQIGGRYTYSLGKLDLSLSGTVALGVTHESFDLEGGTHVVRLDASTADTAGGLYVLGTNAGHTERNRFSYVPEARADLTYHFNDCISVGVGYTFIYWNRVARPGDQIDPVIDRQQLPSSLFYDASQASTHPGRRDSDSGFWAQGVSIQAGLRF